jgi:hypothetical protein
VHDGEVWVIHHSRRLPALRKTVKARILFSLQCVFKLKAVSILHRTHFEFLVVLLLLLQPLYKLLVYARVDVSAQAYRVTPPPPSSSLSFIPVPVFTFKESVRIANTPFF